MESEQQKRRIEGAMNTIEVMQCMGRVNQGHMVYVGEQEQTALSCAMEALAAQYYTVGTARRFQVRDVELVIDGVTVIGREMVEITPVCWHL